MAKSSKPPFSYKIPLRPHLKVFISKFTDVEPYELTMQDFFGRLILHEMVKSVNEDYKPKYKHNYVELEMVVARRLLNKKGCYHISNKSISGINSYLNRLFYFTLVQFITLRQSTFEEKLIDSVRLFYKYYKLNEDLISHSTVLQYLQRNL